MILDFAQAAPATNASNVLFLGAIVAISGIIGPLFLAALNAKANEKKARLDAEIRAKEKAEDYARQDAVAAAAQAVAEQAAMQADIVAEQAAKAAALLLDRQEKVRRKADEVAKRLKATDERVAETAKDTSGKLDGLATGQQAIHVLVNSQMDAALEAELQAEKGKRATLIEIIALKKAMGHKPSPDTLAALKATEEHIGELDATLAERKRAARAAEAKPTKKPVKKKAGKR